MCGLAGIISFNNAKISKGLIKKMTDSLIHRGPDGEGFWINSDEKVALGHRRLAIIDLSENANQPMVCRKTGNVIVFNGEIYNYLELRNELKLKGYSFYTNSDTEVLLALYDLKKENCLCDLNGMFAFAIWDVKEQKLFCARDRFGEKPFYYYIDQNQFVFASEMKAIWSYGIKKELKQNALENYVCDGKLEYEDGVIFFKHIRAIPPACYLKINLHDKKTEIKRYYTINIENDNRKLNFNDAKNLFYEMMENSVKLRLRSDVAVGSSFSGGIDSSSIVYLVNKLEGYKKKIYTFSARFKNFEKDEGYYIKKFIDQYPSVINYSIWPNETNFLEETKKLVYHQEEPFGSASIFAQWCVMRLAKEHGVIVLLDGQGADEILGGYKSCVNYFMREMIFKNYFLYLKEIFLYNSRQSYPEWKIERYEKNETIRMKLGRWKILMTRNHNKIPYNFNYHLREITTHDNDLVTLLRYADRNSMAFSREIRLPFLDFKLVDFLFNLPSHFKFKNGWTKYILRKSFEDKLPDEIVWRKTKIGYEPPQARWFLMPQIQEIIKNQARLFDVDLKSFDNSGYINNIYWRLYLSYFYC